MARSTVAVELPGPPTAELHAATKGYVDTALAAKPGVPFYGPVPAGSTTPTITHNLNTTDVTVTVYRTTDGIEVGVPADRVDANNVQLTFSTAPTSGQYRVVISAGTGAGGPGGGGPGGVPDPHAASHGEGGTDPITPAMIGAATDDHTHDGGGHDHAGVYAPVVHNHNGLAPNGGLTGQVLTKNSDSHYDFAWAEPTGGGGGGSAIKPWPPVALPQGVNEIHTNAAAGTHFRITLTMDAVLARPTNPTSGQIIIWEVLASGAERTLTTLAGAFQFGRDIIALSPVATGATDYIQAIYDERVDKWRIISYVKGYIG